MRNLDGIISLEYIYGFNKIRNSGSGFFSSRQRRASSLVNTTRLAEEIRFGACPRTDAFYSRDGQAVLFSRGKIAKFFYTEDSKLYVTPREQKLAGRGIKFNRAVRKWDSLNLRIARQYQIQKIRRGKTIDCSRMFDKFSRLCAEFIENFARKSRNFANQWSLTQLWNFSLISAILMGMVSMTLIYKFLGPGASAGDVIKNGGSSPQENIFVSSQVLGAAAGKNTWDSEKSSEYVEKIIRSQENSEKENFEKEIREMVKGYPIEKMVPYIMEKDKIVAAFLIGIAKKESDWGKHVPVLQGQDCYNYWGYRGQRRLMGTAGHTCFNSRKDAVDTVAKRIEFLVSNNKLNTPAKMVIWKCGSDCEATGGHAAAIKWISDVEMYFEKLNN